MTWRRTRRRRCCGFSSASFWGAVALIITTSGTLETLHSSSSRRDPSPEPLRQVERKEREADVLTFRHRSLPGRAMGTCSQRQGPEGRRHPQAERWQMGRRESRRGSKRTCHRDLASCSGIRVLEAGPGGDSPVAEREASETTRASGRVTPGMYHTAFPASLAPITKVSSQIRMGNRAGMGAPGIEPGTSRV